MRIWPYNRFYVWARDGAGVGVLCIISSFEVGVEAGYPASGGLGAGCRGGVG